MFVPSWKIRREIKRSIRQISLLPWLVVSPLRRKLYDAKKNDLIRITQGAVPPASEVAVFLLFQPKGILESTLHTLRYFQNQGVATLVVSNVPLSDADRKKIRPLVWSVMERPNFGYDFGGYRDGILHILQTGLNLNRLYVLNDSVWFPLREECDFLDEARHSKADLFGFVLNTRMRMDRRKHVQSYFYSFSGHLAGSDDFKQHWQNLFLTNNKELVVRRCEIPLTDAFRKLGYSVAFRHTYKDGGEALKTLSNEMLHAVIAYQAQIDTRNEKVLNRHLRTDVLDEKWRAAVYQDIDAGVFEKYFLITHPAVLIDVLNSPFLKKDRQEIYQLQRAELINGQYDHGFASVISKEIADWDK